MLPSLKNKIRLILFISCLLSVMYAQINPDSSMIRVDEKKKDIKLFSEEELKGIDIDMLGVYGPDQHTDELQGNKAVYDEKTKQPDDCDVNYSDTRRELLDICLKNRLDSLKFINSFSVFGIFTGDKIKDYDSNRVMIDIGETYGSRYALCTTERYWKQPSSAIGTAFFVGEDLVVTARHCVENQRIGDLFFIFGFEVAHQSGFIRNIVPADHMYQAKEVVYMGQDDDDFVIIRVDRPVMNRLMPVWPGSEKINEKTVLHCIGYPMGLPAKIVSNAKILNNKEDNFFYATLDTYRGNSGSPVFDSGTGTIVGMLVQGMQDFIYNGSCYTTNICYNHCIGEKILRIDRVMNILNELAEGK